jgi:hypothetical protein
MARYRRTDTRWIHAACLAGAYLVAVAVLFTLQVGEAIVVPIPFAVSAPPLVYAALSVMIVRNAAFVRRLSWLGGACLVHVLLGALASLELMWAGGLPAASALAQIFILFAPASALTLLTTPLLLAVCGPNGGRMAKPDPPATRADSSAPRPATTPAAARPAPFTRSVRTAVPRPASAPVPSTPAAGRLSAFAPAPPTPSASAPAAPAVPTPPSAAAPAPPAAPTPPPAAAPAPPAASSRVREARGAEARRPTPGDDPMVRVSFARIAPQLPPEAFVLPLERLSESLREPHALLVPRRVVLAQMREGGIAIDWATVAPQFPELALGMSDAEFQTRYPDLKLWLPVDEVVRQLPPDTVPLVSAVLNAEALEVPPPARPAGDRRPARSTPAAAPTTRLASSSAPPRPDTAGAPPAPMMSVPAAEPPVAVVAAPVVETSPATRPRVDDIVDRETVARVVACFGGVGTFETAGSRVAGSPAVSLVAPSLPRDAVAACASGAAGFLTGGASEVVTVRTARAVVVLAAAPTSVVVAARRPGAPVALLEMRAARAAVTVGNATARTSPAPGRALKALAVDERAAGAAQMLAGFGDVEPAVFADGAARIYVFSAHGRDAAPLGALAVGVCEALREAVGELGRLVSVMFRCGSECTLVRPVGRGSVLVAKGKVTRPGRVHRDAERAATILEAL